MSLKYFIDDKVRFTFEGKEYEAKVMVTGNRFTLYGQMIRAGGLGGEPISTNFL